MDYPLIFYPIEKVGMVWGDREATGAGGAGGAGEAGGGK